jgi:hypothetical protein
MIVTSEMEWFVRYAWTRKENTMLWVTQHSTQIRDAYAYRQADMWRRVGIDAKTRFQKWAKVSITID